MKLHAEWLLRVYGDELARPAMQAAPPSSAAGTLELIERLLAEKDQPGYVLFSPGPVMTSARVKASLVHYDVCHRDGDYAAVVGRLQEKLRPAFGASPAHEMLLLTGSGTAAMEMSIASVVPPGKKLLVIANGAFGDRLDEIAALHGIPRVMLRYRWGELPNAARRRARPRRRPRHRGGRDDPPRDVGRPAQPGGRGRAVCAARAASRWSSTLSRRWAPRTSTSCATASTSASRRRTSACTRCRACRSCASRPRCGRASRASRRASTTWTSCATASTCRSCAQTPFTPAVSSFFALETALDELVRAGRRAGAARALSQAQRAHPPRCSPTSASSRSATPGRESQTISMLRLPDGLSVDALYDGLKARGFIIYRAKGELADRHIQVSNMGELPDATIDAFLAAVDRRRRAARAPRRRAARARAQAGRRLARPCAPRCSAATAGPRSWRSATSRRRRPGPGEVQVRVSRRRDEPHRSVAAAGAAGAAGRASARRRAATSAASSRRSARA